MRLAKYLQACRVSTCTYTEYTLHKKKGNEMGPEEIFSKFHTLPLVI